jgi:hypothetical protein
MADPVKSEGPDADWMRRLAAARGLGRAYAMFPDAVAAAHARASQCLTALPPTFPATTAPSFTFNPAAFTVTE